MKIAFYSMLLLAISTHGLGKLSHAAQVVSQRSMNFPGGIAEIRIEKQVQQLPEVKFGMREPVVMDYPNYWRILIGLDLDMLPGEYVAYIKPAIKGLPGGHEKIVVEQQVYPFSELSDTDLNSQQWTLRKKHKRLSDIDFSNTQQPSLPLLYPLEGGWSNTFGHRIYSTDNQQLHTPNAIYLSTTQFANVVAPQNAIVSRIEIEANGLSTVFLDHGRGLYSIISGLSDLTIEIGNGIVAGAVIGRLPSQNAENGAKNLVWQTVINGVYVNPKLLTQIEP